MGTPGTEPFYLLMPTMCQPSVDEGMTKKEANTSPIPRSLPWDRGRQAIKHPHATKMRCSGVPAGEAQGSPRVRQRHLHRACGVHEKVMMVIRLPG